MLPNLISPYGIDVQREIAERSGLGTLEAFTDFVRDHLGVRYGLTGVVLDQIHLAGALALMVTSRGHKYVFKIDWHDDEAALDALLGRVETLRCQGLPFPRIYQTQAGNLFGSPLGGDNYKGYLTDFVVGEPVVRWSAPHADATAACLARMHQLGADEPVQPGEGSSFGARWPELEDSVSRLAAAGALPEPALGRSLELVASGPPSEELTWTHVHGDARLCHFLFSSDELTGLIDHDAGMWGQRLLDVAFHLISHSEHDKVAFLTVADIGDWLSRYQAVLPLTKVEQAALPDALSCALLIEMGETLWTLETKRAGVSVDNLTAGVQLLEGLQVHLPTLLETL